MVTRLVTGRVRAHSCVRETCVRRLHAAGGVPLVGIFCLLRGGVGLEYDLVSLGLHCFLRLAHGFYCRGFYLSLFCNYCFIVVRGDAWLLLLSPCNIIRTKSGHADMHTYMPYI